MWTGYINLTKGSNIIYPVIWILHTLRWQYLNNILCSPSVFHLKDNKEEGIGWSSLSSSSRLLFLDQVCLQDFFKSTVKSDPFKQLHVWKQGVSHSKTEIKTTQLVQSVLEATHKVFPFLLAYFNISCVNPSSAFRWCWHPAVLFFLNHNGLIGQQVGIFPPGIYFYCENEVWKEETLVFWWLSPHQKSLVIHLNRFTDLIQAISE